MFASVDVDECSGAAQEIGISGIPDTRFFKNGQELDRVVGNNIASIK